METNSMVELVAFFAGFFTTFGYVPQIRRILKNRRANSVSFKTYAMLSCGVGLWFVVGYLLNSYVMMFWNGFAFLLTWAIILMKKHFDKINNS